jgi:hypothetical protein
MWYQGRLVPPPNNVFLVMDRYEQPWLAFTAATIEGDSVPANPPSVRLRARGIGEPSAGSALRCMAVVGRVCSVRPYQPHSAGHSGSR